MGAEPWMRAGSGSSQSSFPVSSPQFHLAFEGRAVTANLTGEFVGDPMLHLIGLQLLPRLRAGY